MDGEGKATAPRHNVSGVVHYMGGGVAPKPAPKVAMLAVWRIEDQRDREWPTSRVLRYQRLGYSDAWIGARQREDARR
jgi:hypothetical protein